MGPREEAAYDAAQPVEALSTSLKDARKMLKKAQKARKKERKRLDHPDSLYRWAHLPPKIFNA